MMIKKRIITTVTAENNTDLNTSPTKITKIGNFTSKKESFRTVPTTKIIITTIIIQIETQNVLIITTWTMIPTKNTRVAGQVTITDITSIEFN